jgi:hypothetical protein
MRRRRLTVWRVMPHRRHGWIVRTGRRSWWYARKREAVRAAVADARIPFHQPVSLVIQGRDGRIHEERTYPRAADPRRSKG